MADQRFQCTACGKCCYGVLPLSLDDAFANADRFPLAMAWMPVRQGHRFYEIYAQLGAVLQVSGKKVAVLIAPMSYLPPILPCPALSAENLCAIQDSKPHRCRAMPFYAYRDEKDQADLLVPRKGWLCDTSAAASVVYSNRKILDRTDFDLERNVLRKDASALKAYAEASLKQNPVFMKLLVDTLARQAVGQFVVSFHTFLRLDKALDLSAFAKKQAPVLKTFIEKTVDPSLALYHKYYMAAADELAWYLRET